MNYNIICGDVLEETKKFKDSTFDGLFCDPPYGINFMNKKWDHGVPSSEVWKECLRVCKPGAWILVFGGTRTHYRLMVNIEDAGWEIRDCIMWVYGSGFPKSYNISKGIDKHLGKNFSKTTASGVGFMRPDGGRGYNVTKNKLELKDKTSEEAKQWEGYGTALKPAWEPIIVARKPIKGNNVKNCLECGCGGLNIDGCRVETTDSLGGGALTSDKAVYSKGGFDRPWMHDTEKLVEHKQKVNQNVKKAETLGRWPANFIHDGSEDVLETFPNTKSDTYADAGSAARFFYTAKVSPKERNAGLKNEPDKVGGGMSGTKDGSLKTGSGNTRNNVMKNNHPTLKPISLTEYLSKLILPPEREDDRMLFIPFSGSGSEIIGSLLSGWDFVQGIEWEQEYCDVSKKRIDSYIKKNNDIIDRIFK